MGIIKEIATDIAKGVAVDAGLDAIDKGIEVGGKASDFFSQKIEDIKDSRNKSALKKQVKKDYGLLVSAEKNLGDGIYNVVTNKKESWYNTLMDHMENGAFNIHLYHERKGELLIIEKAVEMKSGLFSSKISGVYYYLHSGDKTVEVIRSREGSDWVYITNFNDWVIAGDFKKKNYKIFSKSTGKTVAEISKKYASADTFAIVCDYDRYEPIVVAISILIDVIE